MEELIILLISIGLAALGIFWFLKPQVENILTTLKKFEELTTSFFG